MRSYEALVLAELKTVSGNSKIRQKDIMQWSTGQVKIQGGETHFYLPDLGVNVAVKLPQKKARKA